MTYQELIRQVARRARVRQTITRVVVRELFAELGAAAASEDVRVPGFGTFGPRSRAARAIVDPVTRKRRQLPKLYTVGLRPAKRLKTTAARAHRRAA